MQPGSESSGGGGPEEGPNTSSRTPLLCLVPGCGVDVSEGSHYLRRHRICQPHLKSLSVDIAGVACRFCQQCGRFQPVVEFRDNRKSCEAALHAHNARRRVKREVGTGCFDRAARAKGSKRSHNSADEERSSSDDAACGPVGAAKKAAPRRRSSQRQSAQEREGCSRSPGSGSSGEQLPVPAHAPQCSPVLDRGLAHQQQLRQPGASAGVGWLPPAAGAGSASSSLYHTSSSVSANMAAAAVAAGGCSMPLLADAMFGAGVLPMAPGSGPLPQPLACQLPLSAALPSSSEWHQLGGASSGLTLHASSSMLMEPGEQALLSPLAAARTPHALALPAAAAGAAEQPDSARQLQQFLDSLDAAFAQPLEHDAAGQQAGLQELLAACDGQSGASGGPASSRGLSVSSSAPSTSATPAASGPASAPAASELGPSLADVVALVGSASASLAEAAGAAAVAATQLPMCDAEDLLDQTLDLLLSAYPGWVAVEGAAQQQPGSDAMHTSSADALTGATAGSPTSSGNGNQLSGPLSGLTLPPSTLPQPVLSQPSSYAPGVSGLQQAMLSSSLPAGGVPACPLPLPVSGALCSSVPPCTPVVCGPLAPPSSIAACAIMPAASQGSPLAAPGGAWYSTQQPMQAPMQPVLQQDPFQPGAWPSQQPPQYAPVVSQPPALAPQHQLGGGHSHQLVRLSIKLHGVTPQQLPHDTLAALQRVITNNPADVDALLLHMAARPGCVQLELDVLVRVQEEQQQPGQQQPQAGAREAAAATEGRAPAPARPSAEALLQQAVSFPALAQALLSLQLPAAVTGASTAGSSDAAGADAGTGAGAGTGITAIYAQIGSALAAWESGSGVTRDWAAPEAAGSEADVCPSLAAVGPARAHSAAAGEGAAAPQQVQLQVDVQVGVQADSVRSSATNLWATRRGQFLQLSVAPLAAQPEAAPGQVAAAYRATASLPDASPGLVLLQAEQLRRPQPHDAASDQPGAEQHSTGRMSAPLPVLVCASPAMSDEVHSKLLAGLPREAAAQLTLQLGLLLDFEALLHSAAAAGQLAALLANRRYVTAMRWTGLRLLGVALERGMPTTAAHLGGMLRAVQRRARAAALVAGGAAAPAPSAAHSAPAAAAAPGEPAPARSLAAASSAADAASRSFTALEAWQFEDVSCIKAAAAASSGAGSSSGSGSDVDWGIEGGEALKPGRKGAAGAAGAAAAPRPALSSPLVILRGAVQVMLMLVGMFLLLDMAAAAFRGQASRAQLLHSLRRLKALAGVMLAPLAMMGLGVFLSVFQFGLGQRRGDAVARARARRGASPRCAAAGGAAGCSSAKAKTPAGGAPGAASWL